MLKKTLENFGMGIDIIEIERFRKKNYLKSLVIGFISNVIGSISSRGHSSRIYVFEKIFDFQV